jgi:hypothetical protein
MDPRDVPQDHVPTSGEFFVALVCELLGIGCLACVVANEQSVPDICRILQLDAN